MKRMFWITLALISLGGCSWLFLNSRSNTETPSYKTTRTDGAYELREYPAMKLAQTGMASDMDGSFMRLFRYITGDNEGSAKIAMTTPVLINRDATKGSMSFIVPKSTEEQGAPTPKSDKVRVAEMPGGTFAVFRFKGNAKSQNEAEALKQLRDWCVKNHISTEPDPVFAYYDPPWTPTMLRRNEVMLRVK